MWYNFTFAYMIYISIGAIEDWAKCRHRIYIENRRWIKIENEAQGL